MNLFVGESSYLFSIPCYATSLTVNYVWLGVNRAAVLTHRSKTNIFHPFRKFFHCPVSILNPIIKYCCRYRMLLLIYTKIMSPSEGKTSNKLILSIFGRVQGMLKAAFSGL